MPTQYHDCARLYSSRVELRYKVRHSINSTCNAQLQTRCLQETKARLLHRWYMCMCCHNHTDSAEAIPLGSSVLL